MPYGEEDDEASLAAAPDGVDLSMAGGDGELCSDLSTGSVILGSMEDPEAVDVAVVVVACLVDVAGGETSFLTEEVEDELFGLDESSVVCCTLGYFWAIAL